jgi:hypothetical protein
MGIIINEKTRRILGPARATLAQLVFDPLGSADTRLQRELRLHVMAQVLLNERLVSAVYAGYENGDFFLLRPLGSPAMREQYQAPPRAA